MVADSRPTTKFECQIQAKTSDFTFERLILGDEFLAVLDRDGLFIVFIRHTSASLLIQKNADPNVQRDLETFLAKLVPQDPHANRHDSEGPDNMPAHIKGALTTTHLSIPVNNQGMTLGRR